MNCQAAQSRIFAARDHALTPAEATALAAHTSSCPACQALQLRLEQAAQAWRETDAAVALPDAQAEWHAVRRRLRRTDARSSWLAAWTRMLRVAAPLTAVAAIALVVWINRRGSDATPTTLTSTAPVARRESAPAAAQSVASSAMAPFSAHAEYVETDDENASPFVYVDDESGWLIVWASDPPADKKVSI